MSNPHHGSPEWKVCHLVSEGNKVELYLQLARGTHRLVFLGTGVGTICTMYTHFALPRALGFCTFRSLVEITSLEGASRREFLQTQFVASFLPFFCQVHLPRWSVSPPSPTNPPLLFTFPAVTTRHLFHFARSLRRSPAPAGRRPEPPDNEMPAPYAGHQWPTWLPAGAAGQFSPPAKTRQIMEYCMM